MAMTEHVAPRSWRERHPHVTNAGRLAALQRAVQRVAKQARPVLERVKAAHPDTAAQALAELRALERAITEAQELADGTGK